MLSDPIVDEVRRIRLDIEREYGGDLHAYCQHLRRIQKKFGDRLVSGKPKPLVVRAEKKPAA